MSRGTGEARTARDRPTRIGFVNLHARTDNWPHMVMVPQGIMALSAAVKRAFPTDVDVRLHDMTLTEGGVSLETEVERFLREFDPDIVGIRGFTCQAAEFPVVAALAKRRRPDVVVIAGGPHASTKSRTLFDEPAIDFVVPFEGDVTFVELVAALRDGTDPTSVPGVAWDDGGVTREAPPRPLIQDLDALPFPDYSIIDLDRYQGPCTMTGLWPRGRYSSIFTSRGCHYQCAYCHDNFGKRVRYRSVDDVIDEMAWLIDTHGVTEFQIIDDIFNADEERAIRIFDRIVRAGWKIHLAFPNGLRGDVMTEPFVAAARAAGAYYWGLAVESASPRIQKLVKKFNKLDRLAESIAMSRRYGVLTATFNMLGFPTETPQEMEATIRFNLETKPHIAWFFLVMPFEGTTLHEIVSDAALPTPDRGAVLTFSNYFEDGHPWFTTISRPDIQQVIVEAYRRVYFEPERMAQYADLITHGHDPAQLLEFIENRLRATGLDRTTVSPEVLVHIRRLELAKVAAREAVSR